MGKEERAGEHTPQKKCRINITKTRRVTLGPEYIFLNGTVLPSLSRTVKSSILRSVSWVGISLFVFNSPVKSIGDSLRSSCKGVDCAVSIDVFAGVGCITPPFIVSPFVGSSFVLGAVVGSSFGVMVVVAAVGARSANGESDESAIAISFSFTQRRLPS